MARYIAKNVVASGACSKILLQISYMISANSPIHITIDTFNTHCVKKEQIVDAITELFDLSPQGMINTLSLLRPMYKKSAVYGHFGRELPEFTWERIDKSDKIRSYLGL